MDTQATTPQADNTVPSTAPNQATPQPAALTRNRKQGYVIECDGSYALIAADAKATDDTGSDYWSVGQLVSIQCDKVRVVGMLYEVKSASGDWQVDGDNKLIISVEIIGEVVDDENGDPKFSDGLTVYPYLGAICHTIRSNDLAAIFANNDDKVTKIGSLSQNMTIDALVSVDKMIARHFAIVGTTGVGKSTATSLLMRKTVQMRPDLRVLVLDPHNEFANALPNIAATIDEDEFSLPYWLFTMEEFAEAIYNGRTPDHDEIEFLRDFITKAKETFAGIDGQSGIRRQKDASHFTSDTPVPYRISDVLRLIDHHMGTLEGKSSVAILRKLKQRINGTVGDRRFGFMFAERVTTDNLQSVLSKLFRLPDHGKPISILQLSGIPATAINATVSVICRLAFDLGVTSQSRIKTLIVCEEAHRYIPSDINAGFAPTRAAISRIAKEGRKYGVHLGIVTQRPSELDQTILSQCNTIFAMRLGNEYDQEMIKRSIPGGSRSLTNFIASLANREAIAFGEGMSAPMRMRFESVEKSILPSNHDRLDDDNDYAIPDENALEMAINSMRATQASAERRSGDRRVQAAVEQRESTATENHAASTPAPERPKRISYPGDPPQIFSPPSRLNSAAVLGQSRLHAGVSAPSGDVPKPAPSGHSPSASELINRIRRT